MNIVENDQITPILFPDFSPDSKKLLKDPLYFLPSNQTVSPSDLVDRTDSIKELTLKIQEAEDSKAQNTLIAVLKTALISAFLAMTILGFLYAEPIVGGIGLIFFIANSLIYLDQVKFFIEDDNDSGLAFVLGALSIGGAIFVPFYQNRTRIPHLEELLTEKIRNLKSCIYGSKIVTILEAKIQIPSEEIDLYLKIKSELDEILNFCKKS